MNNPYKSLSNLPGYGAGEGLLINRMRDCQPFKAGSPNDHANIEAFFRAQDDTLTDLPEFPWTKAPDTPEDAISTQHHALLEKLFANNKLHESLFATFALATPEFLEKKFYNCGLLIPDEKKTEEDRLCDLSRATRLAFLINNAGIYFWGMLDEAIQSGDESLLLTLRSFITNYSAKNVAEHRKKNPPKERIVNGEFLFNRGILWQLHFNPVLLNQWLLAALQITQQFYLRSFIKYLPIPEQVASVTQEIQVFLRDVLKRLSYGFALIGYQVRRHPQKDERVTKLIMEEVVDPVMASIRVMSEPPFQLLCKALPHILIAAAKDEKMSLGKNVYIDPRNYSFDTEESFEFIYSFQYWITEGIVKHCFGDVRTKIEDVKAKINESKTFPFLDKIPVYMSKLDKAAHELYIMKELDLDDLIEGGDDVVCEVHDVESFNTFLMKVFFKTQEIDINPGKSRMDSCLLHLLLQEHTILIKDTSIRGLVIAENLQKIVVCKDCSPEDIEKALSFIKCYKENTFRQQADEHLKKWNSTNLIGPIEFLGTVDPTAPQKTIEERSILLAGQMIHLDSEFRPRYPDWTFIYYIFPAFVICFRKTKGEFEHKLSKFYLEELLSLLTKDYDAWRSGSGLAEMSTNCYLTGDPSYVTSLLAWRKKFLDRICHAVSKKCKNVTAPIEKLNELLSLNAANNVPSRDPAMTYALHRFAFDWTLRGIIWTNMMIFALTEAISKCATEPSSNLKSLLLAIYSMIELVSLFETQSSEFNAQRDDLNLRFQTLDDAYLELMGENKTLSKSKGAANAWQRLGVILHLLYDMCKTVEVPGNYKPPIYYPEDTKLIITHFAEKKLDKLKIAIASICIDVNRQDRTWTSLEVMNNSPQKLFTPYLDRIKKGKIRRWHEDVLIPVKHCRFCGKVNGNLVMCSACQDNDDYPDVNWFCGEECETKAFLKTSHKEDHEDFIIHQISFE
ncbi:uncharacterized protein LOC132203002 [Neocloeon triangulifer]|uniref:uncharacterized protein LOC132203002 n=1 Tax=Neocloeon triangulifer TaxID=2078957 RepID=UPI00286EEE35|nr:uncharacterized protein LOC132203002 [Neocloeon triangulifer]